MTGPIDHAAYLPPDVAANIDQLFAAIGEGLAGLRVGLKDTVARNGRFVVMCELADELSTRPQALLAHMLAMALVDQATRT